MRHVFDSTRQPGFLLDLSGFVFVFWPEVDERFLNVLQTSS
jgi:hypothetical protein